jgi:hypothetical protein
MVALMMFLSIPKIQLFVIKLNRGVFKKTSSIGQTELSPELRKMADKYVDVVKW